MFPVHEVWVEVIKKEWHDPERKLFFSSALKHRFPFSEDPASVRNKNPKLDVTFSQVFRHTDLAFKDMGALSNAMRKRMDSFEKVLRFRCLKPAMAVTCNLEFWLTRLQAHIEEGTSKESMLTSFPMTYRGRFSRNSPDGCKVLGAS